MDVYLYVFFQRTMLNDSDASISNEENEDRGNSLFQRKLKFAICHLSLKKVAFASETLVTHSSCSSDSDV